MNLTEFVNVIFSNRKAYENVTVKEKESFFFFVNKQLGRKLPEHAESFNHRNTNKSLALDTWVLFIENLQNSGDRDWPRNRTPNWFWGKKASGETEILTPDQVILNMIEKRKVSI
jgi:hypothetical protein